MNSSSTTTLSLQSDPTTGQLKPAAGFEQVFQDRVKSQSTEPSTNPLDKIDFRDLYDAVQRKFNESEQRAQKGSQQDKQDHQQVCSLISQMQQRAKQRTD